MSEYQAAKRHLEAVEAEYRKALSSGLRLRKADWTGPHGTITRALSEVRRWYEKLYPPPQAKAPPPGAERGRIVATGSYRGKRVTVRQVR